MSTPHDIAMEYAGKFVMNTNDPGRPYCDPESVVGRAQRLAEAYLAAEAIVNAARELPEFFQVDERTHSFVPLLDVFDEKVKA